MNRLQFSILFALAGTTTALGQPLITHTFTFGPAGSGTQSFNLDMHCTGGDDWNASTIFIETFEGVTIVSPVDNTFGQWAPPFPDSGTTVDTYLRSPSAPPLFLPQLVAPSYTPEVATATWLDPAGTVAPADFLGARVALNIPVDLEPTFEPIGAVIAVVEISSATRIGGGVIKTDTFTLYSGSDIGSLAHTVALTNHGDGTHTLDLNIDGTTNAYWTSSTISAESDGATEFLSPLDNAAGAWAPPVPDDPAFVDTYLRSPSAPDAIPLLSAGSYATTSLSATWSDDPAGAAPPEFRLARLAFTAPLDAQPTLSAIGDPLFTLSVESVGENIDQPAIDTIVIYDGIQNGTLAHTLTLTNQGGGTHTLDLNIDGTASAYWTSSTISAESDGAAEFLSPLDNAAGAWAPPVPDDPAFVDTYLRSPSAPDAIPLLSAGSYATTSLSATWSDDPAGIAPSDFRLARLAFNAPDDAVPTRLAIGLPLFTLYVESIGENTDQPAIETIVIYDGIEIDGPQISHSLTAGPSNGAARSYNLDFSLFNGDDWNASTIFIETFEGVTIVSPVDNTFGQWAPPFPDTGTAVDTYLRSPSAPPLFLPQLVAPSYTPEVATATWLDPAGTTSPAAFLGSRIALNIPSELQPTFEPIGRVIAEIVITSVTQQGGGVLKTDTFTLYSGVLMPDLTHVALIGDGGDGRHTLDLDIVLFESETWQSSTLSATATAGTELLSPLDNAAGEWAPPVPDDPAFVDTYLRSPSAVDALPIVTNSSYTPAALSATWEDASPNTAPTRFRASRLAFTAPAYAQPTLDPIGIPLLTVTIASTGQTVGEVSDTVVVYDGLDPDLPRLTHELSFGPSGENQTSVNVEMRLTGGDDWNTSLVSVETFKGVTIVSPNDNVFGAWFPAFPDDGTVVDTYVRSPSNLPTAFPQTLLPSYSPTFAAVTWLDPAGTISPDQFLGARIAFDLPPGYLPTLEPVGPVIATVSVGSATQFGGGVLVEDTWTIYAGVPDPDVSHSIATGPSADGLYTVDLTLSTASGAAWQTSTATLTTFAGTTIVSPDDNVDGAWSPPNPDAGDALDTYVRSPSNAPTFAPALLSSSYGAQSASVTWEDLPIGSAPTSFLAGRFALAIPEGATPTLSPVGRLIATLTVESRSTLSVDPTTDTYSIYDGVSDPQTTHTLTAGPSTPGAYAFDLNVSTLADYDWNAGDLQVVTFGDIRIVDPLDNDTSEWSPPFPDDGTTIDTYVRAPSNAPKFKPGRLEGVFGGSFLDVEWSDTLVGVAPPEFLAARISLLTPFGVVPTLEPIGSVIATITIESEATGAPTQLDVFNVYDGIAALAVNHSLLAGPSDGVQFSYDVFMATTLDNDWNASTLLANTYLGATIVSPDDNVNGAWFPPFPDDLTAIDTYVRSPSNDPTAFPSILLPGYSPTSAVVTWYDPAGTTAPQSFQGARVAIVPPAGIVPSLDTGSVLAEIEMASTSQAGGGILSEQTLRVYDGVVPRLTVRCTERNGRWAVRGRVTLGTPGSVVTATLDGAAAQAITVGADDRVGFQFANAGAGTHTVTITLDSGTTVEEVIVCE